MEQTEKKYILVVDDDVEIVRAIRLILEREGYAVYGAYDGMQALDIASTKEIHLIIIDVMMPKLDGISAILKIRERKNIPIIVLSAKSENDDKVLGLSSGADDYVTKPFNPGELVARVKSQLRRYTSLGDINAAGKKAIVNGRLVFKPDEHELLADNEPVKLTAKELKIIELLMNNLGRIFSADEIYERVWEDSPYLTENTVMVHIRHIRSKIEINPAKPEYLKVVWGIGYKMERH